MVGAVDDRAEHEADRLADEVIGRLMRDADPAAAQAATAPQPIHRSAGSAAPVAEVGREGGPLSEGLTRRIEGARGGGSALPDELRARYEPAFGSSLSHVRIHDGAESAHLNRMVSARAFTTGSDIFFGAGQYRPDTPEGEHVLLHELAHTRQQSAVRRTAIHRTWDFKAGQIDWSKTRWISTIPTGQAVFFMEDATGDRLVVKSERNPAGLAEMAATAHEALSNVKSVHHMQIEGQQRQQLTGMIADPSRSKLEPTSWTALGKMVRKDYGPILDEMKSKNPNAGEPSDIAVAQYFQADQVTNGSGMIAMTYAAGDTASKAGRSRDVNPMRPEKNRMRSLLTNFKHMEALGQLTAVDIFLGNGDRVMAGNLGNWIYDPHGTSVTAIDHVDDTMRNVYVRGGDTTLEIGRLAKAKLGETAAYSVQQLAHGMVNPVYANDTDFVTWIDSQGGYRRQLMEEALQNGLEAGRKLLIKTFTSTRFTIGGGKARAVKKSIKKAANAGTKADKGFAGDSPDHYYRILKSRAEWLKKN